MPPELLVLMRVTRLLVRTSMFRLTAAARNTLSSSGPTGLPSLGAWNRLALAPPPRVIPVRSPPNDVIQSFAAAESFARALDLRVSASADAALIYASTVALQRARDVLEQSS